MRLTRRALMLGGALAGALPGVRRATAAKSPPTTASALLTEQGDRLLTEQGDVLLIETAKGRPR